MVFPGESFEAEATLSAVARYKCTALHGVPTMFIAQLEHPNFSSYDTSSLRTGIMAGAPCPIETMRQVINRMHMSEVTIGYGMTETSPLSFQSRTGDPIERRVTTVGRIHPHVEVKIIDATGNVVRTGASGELCTRGYGVMRGYWDDAERSAEAIDPSGWMHSGDIAAIDDQGYCTIIGRLKDMLIRGGENIYPREIEDFLIQHPKVQSAQVFGVPDHRLGEEVCAFIVLKPGQSAADEEIRTFSEDRSPSQSATLRSLCSGISLDGDGQATEVRHARTYYKRTRPAGGEPECFTITPGGLSSPYTGNPCPRKLIPCSQQKSRAKIPCLPA